VELHRSRFHCITKRNTARQDVDVDEDDGGGGDEGMMQIYLKGRKISAASNNSSLGYRISDLENAGSFHYRSLALHYVGSTDFMLFWSFRQIY
jgi:hypothetical protein